MMKAVVNNIIHSSIAALHSEGLLLFPLLETAYKANEPIEVSFEGITRCATQFLNASIGMMYMHYDPVVLDALITYDFAGLNHLPAKINEVKDNAIHSKDYDSLVEAATV